MISTTKAQGIVVKELLAPIELTDVLGCKRTKVYELSRKGERPSFEIGRLRQVLREDAKRWREKQKV